jgi:hypothetical protein
MTDPTDHRTPHSMPDIRAAIEAAWPAALGCPAPPGAVQLLGAQIDLETASGEALMGNNLGNVKSNKADPTAITFATFEYYGGVRHELAAGDPGAYFRAWPDLASGAAGYLQIMINRFGQAWPFVLDGDTAGFAAALRAQRYYTAPEDQYLAGLYARGAPRTPPPVAVDDPTGTLENADDTAVAKA